MGKIITVTLNPCIDLFLTIPAFTHGGMNRVSASQRFAAGKGINVSVALNNLGVKSLCTGFLFRDNGALFTKFLSAQGIAHDFVEADGAVRTNIKLMEAGTKTMTEINQPGELVPQEKITELTKKIAALNAAEDDILILSGSRPQGVGCDIYNVLCGIPSGGNVNGCASNAHGDYWRGRVFLDMEGAALTSAARSARPPYLIKPNLFELETAYSQKFTSKEEIISFCKKEFCERGIEIVCVSMGGEGAILVTPNDSAYAPALNIPVRGLAGAGDSMVAGFAYGMANGASAHDTSIREAFKYAMAAAAASVIKEGTQMCAKEDFEKMAGEYKSRI